MPDLKERPEDILLFANFFLDQANRELERTLIGFDAAASEALQRYSWPGNLRQLKNIVKRATLLARGEFITVHDLGEEILAQPVSPATSSFALHDEEAEKKRIMKLCNKREIIKPKQLHYWELTGKLIQQIKALSNSNNKRVENFHTFHNYSAAFCIRIPSTRLSTSWHGFCLFTYR